MAAFAARHAVPVFARGSIRVRAAIRRFTDWPR